MIVFSMHIYNVVFYNQYLRFSNSFNYGDYFYRHLKRKSYFYMFISSMFTWDLEMLYSDFQSCLGVTS